MPRYYALAAVVILLDQCTKWLVATYMDLYEAIPVLGDFFQIYSHRNQGAAFGILQGQRLFFIVVASAVSIFIIRYLHKIRHERGRLLPWGLGVMLGGAAGNLIDRLIRGEVVDFFKFHFQFAWFGGARVDYVFPIFNVADVALNVAVGLVILDALLQWGRERKGKLSDESV